MKEAILSVLMTLPSPVQEKSHLETVAAAIDSASLAATCQGGWDQLGCKKVWPVSRVTLAAGLMAIGFFESGFNPRIQRNECRVLKGECDAGQSRTYWQFKRTGPATQKWHLVVGDDWWPTTQAAYTSAWMLGGAWKGCRRGAPGAVSRYATGKSCVWSREGARVRLWMSLEAKLRSTLAQN